MLFGWTIGSLYQPAVQQLTIAYYSRLSTKFLPVFYITAKNILLLYITLDLKRCY